MADLKISQLPAATTPVAGTEVLPIVQSGTTSKVSIADLTVGRNVTATTFLGGLDTNVAAAGLTVTGTTVAADGTDTNIDLTLTPQGSGVVTTAATYSDGGGKLRAIPQSGSAKTASYILAGGDVGKFIEVGASGSIEIPDQFLRQVMLFQSLTTPRVTLRLLARLQRLTLRVLRRQMKQQLI
jgi:hypothetical protein